MASKTVKKGKLPKRFMQFQQDYPEVARAYSPYLIIIAIFAIVNIGPVKSALAEKPWTYSFNWPGLNMQTGDGEPQASMTYNLNWLPAAGTLMILAGLITMVVLKVSPARGLQAYKDTYVELRWAILTVMAVLGLAYVMNQSGQTGTLGALLAETGGAFLLLSPILGWLGVAVTGSDTSANALFGALQVQTAAKAGLDPLLLAEGPTPRALVASPLYSGMKSGSLVRFVPLAQFGEALYRRARAKRGEIGIEVALHAVLQHD